MKPNAFIALFNARTKNIDIDPEVAKDIVAELIKPKGYIKYDDKISIALETIDESEKMTPVTPNRSRIFLMKLIGLYTNLEVDIEDYDILNQNLLITPILLSFEREYKECESVLKMCL